MVDEVAVGGTFVIEAAADLVSGSADAVVLTITLPTGLRYAGPTPHTIEDMSCDSTPPTIVCRDADPDVAGGTAAGRFFKLIVDGSVPAGTALTVTAAASVEGADDPVASNDVVTRTTTAEAGDDLTAHWEHADYTVVAGHDVTLVMVVRNEGTHSWTVPRSANRSTPSGPRDPEVRDRRPAARRPGRTYFGDPGEAYCEFDLGPGAGPPVVHLHHRGQRERAHAGGARRHRRRAHRPGHRQQHRPGPDPRRGGPAATAAPADPAAQTPVAAALPAADALPRTGAPVLAYSALGVVLMLIGSGLCVAGRMMPRKPTCAVPVSTI